MKIETLAPEILNREAEGNSPETETTSTEILEQLLPELILLDSDEFCSLFDISLRTAYEWRRDGTVAYVRINGRLYYRLSDVLGLLNNFTYKNDTHTSRKK